MSATSALLTKVSEEEGIAWLTLNRPERKNVLSKALMAEIIDCLKELRENDNIRCIVTTGAGDSFCSGLDLYDLRESWKRKRRLEEGGTPREIITLLRSCPQVTIAAVKGYCLGGGLILLNWSRLGVRQIKQKSVCRKFEVATARSLRPRSFNPAYR